jgi:YHS domain-containing protein
MARVLDAVCGMAIESDETPRQSIFQGQTYYFCSLRCLREFEADPARYAESAKTLIADRPEELERHEPPITKKWGIVAPKFGAAGFGGAEYELPPEQHDDRDDG